MKYPDLKKLKKIYKDGGNISLYLREMNSPQINTIKSVELAYDLQSGTYIKSYQENKLFSESYTSEMGEIIRPYLSKGDKILDCGTGEMTTLAGVANNSFPQNVHIYCFDLSLSRILFGKKYVQNNMCENFAMNLSAFVAELTAIPLLNKSMDITITCHALEPNYGREEQILKEIFRVTSHKIVLFEPSYENNHSDGRKRMEQLGYVRNLPKHIENLGGKLEKIIPLKHIVNPMNPTYAYVIDPPNSQLKTKLKEVFACPASNSSLVISRKDCYYSKESMLVYPIISGVPILRKEVAIVSFYPEML